MGDIMRSASKVVFIMIALTACVGFMVGRLSPGDFMILAGCAFAFYFSNKGETKPPEAGGMPFAGK